MQAVSWKKVTSSREYLVYWVSTCCLFSINTVQWKKKEEQTHGTVFIKNKQQFFFLLCLLLLITLHVKKLKGNSLQNCYCIRVGVARPPSDSSKCTRASDCACPCVRAVVLGD